MARFNRERFEREVVDLPAHVIAGVAVRAAMRALPVLAITKRNEAFWYWPANERPIHAFAVFHAYQVSAVFVSDDAARAPRPRIGAASAVAARAASACVSTGAPSYAAARAASYAADASSATSSTAPGYAAARATTSAVKAAGIAANASDVFADVAADALEKDFTVVKSATASMPMEKAKRLTIVLLEQPLWASGIPAPLAGLWQRFQADVLSLDSGFEVWLDWYRDRLDGKPFDLKTESEWAYLSKERLAQTPAEINAYLKALRDGTAPKQFNRVRAIFIGHGEVGKSSLIAALHGEDVVAGEGTMTKGVDISRSTAPALAPVRPIPGIHEGAGVFTRVTSFDDRDLTVHFWDFGGQVMAHATHQFFLRARCLYVIVLDARPERNSNEEADYWLEHVRAFGDKAPVMLVGNKIDQTPVHIDLRSLKEKHPNVLDFYPISCIGAKEKYRIEFERFTRDFHQALQDLGRHGERFTQSQFEVLKAVDDAASKDDFLPHGRFEEICTTAGIGIEGPQGQATLLDLFDKLGIVMHFPKFSFLTDYVLNPRWLTYGVYTIMYSEGASAGKGRITEAEVVAILKDEKLEEPIGQRPLLYARDRCRLIVDAMVAFGTAYRLAHDPQFLVIPALLDPTQPEHDFKSDGALAFRFHFDGFLPRHVLPALIVRRHRDIEQINGQEIVWQNGVMLRPGRGIDAQALIKADYHERHLDVLVNGSDALLYLGLIRDEILNTLETMPELPCQQKVQLRPDMRLDRADAARFGDPPIWVSHKTIVTVQKNRKTWVPGEDGYLYDLEKVLAVIPVSADLRPADVFISYAHQDRAIVEGLKVEIEKAGHSVWFDQNLIGGQQYRDVLDQRIDAAKAVVVVWTENSVSSRYVRHEADRASNDRKLICLRDPNLDSKKIPGPFTANDHILKVGDRDGLMAALARLGVGGASRSPTP